MLSFVILWSLALTATSAEPIHIRFSHVVSEQTPKGNAANRFKQLVEQKLAGKVTVEVFPRATLYDDDPVLLALARNDVQLAAPSLSKFSTITKSLEFYDLPFLFDDLAAVERFQNSATGQRQLDSLGDKGIKGLAYWRNGMRVISADRPLRAPTDARGLLFRIEPSEVIEEQYRQLGATTIRLPFAHVRDALGRGLVKGQENSWANIYSQNFDRWQPYITETNHSFQGYMVITGSAFWNGLPADIRRELEAILAQVTDEMNGVLAERIGEYRQGVIDRGKAQVITLTDQERNAWRQALAPVGEKFKSQIDPVVLAAIREANAGGK
ncbi:MAG: DctP family TRAP transporter solute-binding subunit [Candidatus Contendobacter sp.]|nr:DctP family TRAP transporter solute-binding subunit [Candidatus Contendobacter sp.]